MTDKQIIIDGVDVSGCDRHCSDNHNRPNMCYCDEMTCGYRTCRPKDNQCNFYIKSIEKQLKRKEQECLTLINKVNRLEEEKNTLQILLEGKNSQYNAIKQEYEKLNKGTDNE